MRGFSVVGTLSVALVLGAAAGTATAQWTQVVGGPGFAAEPSGGGFDLADIGGGGQPDGVSAVYDAPGGGPAEFQLRTCRDVLSNGGCLNWSPVFTADGFGWAAEGAGVAIGEIDNSPGADALIFAYDDPSGAGNTLRYRVLSGLGSAGGFLSDSAMLEVDGAGWVAGGADVALADLDADPRPDLLVLVYDQPSSNPNEFRYRVGYNLEADGSADWADWQDVSGFGFLGGGAALTVADFDGNGTDDLALAAVDITADPAEIWVRVGTDIDETGRALSWGPAELIATLPAGVTVNGLGLAASTFAGGAGVDVLADALVTDNGTTNRHRFMAVDWEPPTRPTPDSANLLISRANDLYADQVWPYVADTLRNHTAHGILDGLDGTLVNASVSTDVTSPPSLKLEGDGMRVRFPEDDQSTWVQVNGTWQPSEAADWYWIKVLSSNFQMLWIKFGIDLAVGRYEALVDTTFDHGGFAQFLETLSQGICVFTLFQECFDWLDPQSQFDDSLDNLAYLESFRWDRENSSLDFGPGAVEWIHADGTEEGTIEIAIVADGFDAQRIPRFEAFAESFVDLINGPGISAEPFKSMSHMLAVRRASVVAHDATGDSNERAVTAYFDPVSSSFKSSFRNLARMGAIVNRYGDADVIALVFEAEELAQELGTSASSLRAMAFGNLVLLPLGNTPDSGEDLDDLRLTEAHVLLHELGHTLLGHLADEYVSGGKDDECYLGPNPSAPNVSTHSSASSVEWSHWVGHHGPTGVVDVYEGAYSWGEGIYRPAPDCKMRSAGDHTPFCPVCRESLAIEMSELVESTEMRFRVEHIEPWVQTSERWFNEYMTKHYILGVAGQPQQYEFQLDWLALPKPWKVEWYIERISGATDGPYFGTTAEVWLEEGDVLVAYVSTTNSSAPSHLWPVHEVRFEVGYTNPYPMTTPPGEPVDAASNVPASDTLALEYQWETGQADYDLQLSATTTCLESWAIDCNVEFYLSGANQTHTHTSPMRPAGTTVTWRPDYLDQGVYKWWVRSNSEGGKSDWVGPFEFKVNSPEYADSTEAHPPIYPNHMLILDTDTVRLSAVAWNLGGAPVRLEFDVSTFDAGLDGNPDYVTGYRASPPEGSRSLRVGGEVVVPHKVGADPVKIWAVRAVTESGPSDWVLGGEYPDHRDRAMITISNWHPEDYPFFYEELLTFEWPEDPTQPIDPVPWDFFHLGTDKADFGTLLPIKADYAALVFELVANPQMWFGKYGIIPQKHELGFIDSGTFKPLFESGLLLTAGGFQPMDGPSMVAPTLHDATLSEVTMLPYDMGGIGLLKALPPAAQKGYEMLLEASAAESDW